MPAYEEDLSEFGRYDAQVLGLSIDTIPTIKAWAKSLGKISYPLLSDFWPHGEISRSYGVLREVDPFKGASERAVFVVDKAGKIRFNRVYPVDRLPDIEETLAALRELART